MHNHPGFWKTATLAVSLLTPAIDTWAKSLPVDKWPAARRNVVKRSVGGKDVYFLRTSKLRRVNNYMFSCTAVPQHIVGNYALDTLIRQAKHRRGIDQ